MNRPPNRTPQGEIYEVFAKFKTSEPLRHIGNVVAPEPGLAREYAYQLYDEWTWSEMILVPRSEIVQLIEPE